MLGTLVGCKKSTELETCLQSTDVSPLVMVQYGVLWNPSTSDIPFCPVVDGLFLPDEVDVCLILM